MEVKEFIVEIDEGFFVLVMVALEVVILLGLFWFFWFLVKIIKLINRLSLLHFYLVLVTTLSFHIFLALA